MTYTTLISVETLAARLDDPDWVICDCRHDLADTDAGRRAYAAGHIPGARFVHLDEDLSGIKTGRNGRHPLPDPEWFARRLGTLGIDDAKQVVAYDASGGYYAARLWWMLRWVGHAAAAVLDGGWEGWTKSGHPATTSAPRARPGRFSRGAALADTVAAGDVARDLENGTRRLFDARSPDRFRGENETLDPVAGHIPGAASRFFKLNLDTAGRFKPPEALRQEFAALLDSVPPSEVVHYCGSGVTACHNLLAMEVAGLAGSRLYPGSWSEWCADPARPVVKSSA